MSNVSKHKGLKEWMKEIIQFYTSSSPGGGGKQILDREEYIITDQLMENKDLTSWINEEILSCSVCFLQYTPENLPKLLACSHTFCQKCIGDFLKENKTKKRTAVTCPMCRRQTRLTEGAGGLPNNYTVLSLIDMVERAHLSARSDAVRCAPTRNALHRDNSRHEESAREKDVSSEADRAAPAAYCGVCRACRGGQRAASGESSFKCCVGGSAGSRSGDMEVGSSQCPVCLGLQPNADYYAEPGMAQFCDHGHQLRPPPVNPEYVGVTYGYGADADYVYNPYVDGQQPVAGYVEDSSNERRPELAYVENGEYAASPMAQVGYDQMGQGGDVVYYQTDRDEQVVPGQLAYGQSNLAPDGAAYGLCDEFVARLKLEDGDDRYDNPPSGYGQPHAHPPAPSSQGFGAPYQPTIQTAPAAHYHTHAVPQLQDSSTPPRSHSPPPAYSEIDQNPQPAPKPATKPSQSVPQQSRRQTRSTKPASTTSSAKSDAKKKASQKPAAKTPANVAQQAKGNSAAPQKVESQRPLRSSPPAAKKEDGLCPAKDRNGCSTRDYVRTDIPPGSTDQPSAASKSPPPPPPVRAVQANEAEIKNNSPSGQEGEESRLSQKPRGPVTPPRRLPGEPQGLPFKCIKRFGSYSDTNMQSGTFQKPTRVSVSKLGHHVIVTDAEEMSVQTFTADGEYVYKFKALGVQGACMWAKDKLAVATHRGIDVCAISGYKETEVPIGPCINAVPYRYGFVAVREKTLVFFNNAAHQTRELVKRRHKSSPFKKYTAFDRIKDVAVSLTKDIAVLESSGDVFIIDDDGVVKTVIQPQAESCGPISDPFSLTFDRWSNVFVSDLASRRVLRFSPNGKFSRCVLNFALGETSKTANKLQPYGVSASSEADHLIVVVGGQRSAEVRIYKLY